MDEGLFRERGKNTLQKNRFGLAAITLTSKMKRQRRLNQTMVRYKEANGFCALRPTMLKNLHHWK